MRTVNGFVERKPELTETPALAIPEGYSVRAADPEDLSAILSVLKPFVQQRVILRRTRSEVQALIPTGFVVLHGQEIVGFSSVEVYSKKLDEIQCLAVSESHQGKGLGGVLVSHCMHLARQLGVMDVLAISSSDLVLISQGFDYALPNQKKALFLQLRSREEVYRELEEAGEE
ncbi:MAG TPA: N-acetylglutamate synthase [Planctomycetaceae bacterium]|nr:N-acetylglutamate synthase [Planctomycetaceae bacterium]